MADVPGLGPDPDPGLLERLGLALYDQGVGGAQAGYAGSLSGLDTLAANSIYLARQGLNKVPGLDYPEPTETEAMFRKRAAQFAEQAGRLKTITPPGATREAATVLGGLPIGAATSIAAVEAGGGPIGLGGLGVLSKADQGVGPAVRAGIEGAVTGKAYDVLAPFNPLVRAGGIGGLTYALSEEEDPTARVTSAAANAIMAGMPSKTPPRVAPGRIPLEGLPAATAEAPLRIEGVKETIPSAYTLVESANVKPSHDPITFSPRSDYAAVQERDYHSSKNEQSKVVSMADGLDPRELLNRAPNANTGPAVVDPDGNVWGGNGRTMAQQRIYSGQAKTTPETLKTAVVESAAQFGLDPKAAAQMQAPMIVRVLGPESVPPTREAGLVLSRLLNVETTHAATPTARAQSNAAALDRALTVFADAAHTTGEEIGTIRQVIGEGQTGRRFAEALQEDGVIPTSERARWLNPEGTLTKNGMDQVEQMLLARVLPDQNLVESIPGELREKIMRNVPAIVAVEGASPGSVGPLVSDMVRSEIARAATAKGGKKLSVEEFNRQLSLDPTEAAPSQRDPRVAAVQRLFEEKNATQLRAIFRSMNARVGAAASGQADLLSQKVSTPREAVDEVLESVAPGSTAAAPPLQSAPAPEQPVAPLPRPVPPERAEGIAQAPPAVDLSAMNPRALLKLAQSKLASAGAAQAELDRRSGLKPATLSRVGDQITVPVQPAEPATATAEPGPAASVPVEATPPPPAAPAPAPPAAPPPPPPRAPRGPAPPPPPEPPRNITPPTGPADYYRRLADRRGRDVMTAKALAKQISKDLQAPFRMTENAALPRPVERRAEETRAVLEEIYQRRADGNPEAAVDDMLRRNDLTIGDHADVIMPTIARFYRDHAWIAKRGVIPDVALRELASGLGMSERQMMRKMIGETPNAETVVAMKQLVDSRLQRVNDLVDKLADPATASPKVEAQFALEHKILGLLWAQFRGAKGELGRALRATQVLAGVERPGVRKLSMSDLDQVFEGTHGGEQNVKLLVDKIRKLRSAPSTQADFMRRSQNATTWDKIMKVYRSALMSGGATVARNLFGNAILQPMYTAARASGTAAGRMIDLLPTAKIRIPLTSKTDLLNVGVGPNTRSPQAAPMEPWHEIVGQLGAGRAAARLWRDTLIGPAPEGGRTIGNVVKGALFENRPPIEDPSVARTPTFKNEKLDALIATPFRINEAFDVGARYPSVVGRLSALAHREALKQNVPPERVAEFMRDFVAEPPEWAWDQAWAHGNRQTLNEPLGPKGEALTNLVRKIPGLQVIAPFLKIPLNLTKELGRYSPAGLAMSDVREQLAAGGAARDEAIGKIMVGTSMSALAVYLGNQGVITGGGPSDPARRKLWLETHRPYSFWDGTKYTSYRGFEPASSVLGVAADIGEKWHELSDSEKALTPGLLVSSMVRNVDDIPVMTGISDALESLASGDPTQIDRWLKKTATSFVVPKITQAGVAGARAVARTAMQAGDDPRFRADPFLRESTGLMESIMQAAGAGNLPAPGASRAAPPKTSFWGEPLRKDETIGPTYLSPFKQFTPKNDAATTELYELVADGAMPLPGDVDRNLGTVRLNDWQFYELKRAARGRAHAMLGQIIGSPRWQEIEAMPPAVAQFTKATVFDAVFRASNEIARAQMRGSFNEADKLRSLLNQRLEHLLVEGATQ